MDTTISKQTIASSKNIYLIPSQEPEAIALTLALFYTLKELNKNVNLLIDPLPENLKFLAPSLDFISYPKNFVMAIPNKIADVSQVYYEKNDQALKIHLTLENGCIKKDNVSFYFSETKPDLIITLGVKDYAKELTSKLNSYGFLLDSPILNIDGLSSYKNNEQENKKFGKINLVENLSLTEIVLKLIKDLSDKPIGKNLANCLLSGIVIYTENFKNKATADIFETTSNLMKSGADLEKITNNIYNIK